MRVFESDTSVCEYVRPEDVSVKTIPALAACQKLNCVILHLLDAVRVMFILYVPDHIYDPFMSHRAVTSLDRSVIQTDIHTL